MINIPTFPPLFMGDHDHDHRGLWRCHTSTGLGRLIATLMMLMGWGTLAVPTGIVTVEMSNARGKKLEITTALAQTV